MANQEIDVIQHLLDVEKEASEIILAAQKQADEIIAHARTCADSEFKQKYSEISKALETQETAQIEQILKNQKSSLEKYKKSLEETSKNVKAFDSALEKLLFA